MRRIAILALLFSAGLGCASSQQPTTINWSTIDPRPVSLGNEGCPYADLFVERPQFGDWDTPLAQRAMEYFVLAMSRHGFRLVHQRDSAYFVALSMIYESNNGATFFGPRWFVWSLRVEAQLEFGDLVSKLGLPARPRSSERFRLSIPLHDSAGSPTEAGSWYFLLDMPVSELEDTARYAAKSATIDFVSHVERKCAEWKDGLRKPLTAEIERVRKQREDAEQQKRLEIEAGTPE